MEPRIRVAKFGDGYDQRSRDGLNTFLPTWKLSFSKRTEADIKQIYYWLISNVADVTPFTWAAPGDVALVTTQFGTGTGSQTSFGLVSGGPAGTFITTPSIYVAGVLKTLTTHYTLSTEGIITFVSAPTLGQILSWSGAYARKYVAVYGIPKPDGPNNWSLSAEFRAVPA